MSGLIALAGTAVAPGAASQMSRAMANRGADRFQQRQDDDVLLAVGRYEWEAGLSTGDLVVEVDRIAAVADATLYGLETLEAALRDRGVSAQGVSPTHLIIAAYRAWGTDCITRLNGDFAFVLWDPQERRLFGARSAGGKRPLFIAEVPGGVVSASSIGGVLAHPRVSDDLNPVAFASAICAYPSVGGRETAYGSIRRIGAGELFIWERERVHYRQFWQTPAIGGVTSDADFAGGAEELRHLLHESVRDRLGADLTALWLSGGWDSSALWGVGQHLLHDTEHRQLYGVSISYPPGDPGREDEFITASASHWNADISWLHIGDIPFFDSLEARAATRDEPFAHMFEGWNRALARTSRAGGARVALDGFGGDQLFQVSEHYLIDLWRRGQWFEVIRDWRQRQLGTAYQLIKGIARPARILRRRSIPWHRLLLRPLPSWLDDGFAKRTALIEREQQYLPPDTLSDISEGETRFYLESPYYSLLNHLISEFALEAGVESRSPLFDDRIVRFATARPRKERASGRETKRLLRHAVRGLLPEDVLAPRRSRTGVTSGYASRGMGQPFQDLVAAVSQTPWLLEDLGIISTEKFQEAIAPNLLAEDGNRRVSAYLTLQTELWLRSRWGAKTTERTPAATKSLDVSRPRGPWAAPSQPLGTL